MADRPVGLGEGLCGTPNHVPPLPGLRGAARASTPQPKSQDSRSDDWSSSFTTRSPVPLDFDTQRVFNLVTDLLLLFCITMPNLAPFLTVVWNESRARPAHELWCPGPCLPRYHVQFALLPWWTTMDSLEIIGSLRGWVCTFWMGLFCGELCVAVDVHACMYFIP